jgi:tetratricopeptide (TPR) repeat protein
VNYSTGEGAWILEGNPVHAHLDAEQFQPRSAARPATDPAVVVALRLHLHGASQEALQELALADSNPDALLLQGQILFEQGRLEEAAESYAKLARKHPDDRFASFDHGICMARMGKWRLATESLQRAVLLDPDLPKAWFALGICELNDRRPVDARACFNRCLKLLPDYAPAWLGLAAACQMEENHDEALAIYERLLEKQPTSRELLSNALAAAMEVEAGPKASAFAARLLEVEPDSRAAALAMFSLAADKRDFETAATWCSKLAKAKLASFEDWFNLGICYQRLGHFDQAIEAFENALKIQPEELDAQEGLAQSLSDLTYTQRAKDAWQRFVELAPEREDGWFKLGLQHFDLEDHAEACKAFERCVQLKPDWRDAWLNLGNIRWKTGAFPEAAGAYEELLKLDPNSDPARRALAALAIDSGDADGADRYREGLSMTHWDVSYNLAVLRQTQGRLDSAATLYREVVGIQPDFAEAWLNLGNVLFALGDREQGKACWKSALEKRPELAGEFLGA